VTLIAAAIDEALDEHRQAPDDGSDTGKMLSGVAAAMFVRIIFFSTSSMILAFDAS